MTEKLRYRLILTVVALIVVLVVVVAWYLFEPPNKTESYPINRVVQYSYEIKNVSSKVVENIDFNAISPVILGPFQRLRSITSSHDFEKIVNDSPNQLLKFSFDKMTPYQTIVIRIRAELELSEEPNIVNRELPKHYLSDEPLLDMSSASIELISDKIVSEKEISTVRKTYDFVRETLKYNGYIKKDMGALWAVENNLGDCTEYSALLTSLLRSNKIPSRRVEGFVYDSNATIRAKDYHAWTEVLIDSSWYVVDALKSSFMENQSSYLAFLYFPVDFGSYYTDQVSYLKSKNISVSMK